MGELEERIEQVLNDPAQMARLGRLAQSLMGGEAPPSAAPNIGEPGPDPALLGRVARLMQAGAGEESGRDGLLRALAPYLSPARRRRLERALRLARLGRVLRLLGEEGLDV